MSPATLVAELLAAEVDLAVQKIHKSATLLLPEVTLYEGCINKYLCSVGRKLLTVFRVQESWRVLKKKSLFPGGLPSVLRGGDTLLWCCWEGESREWALERVGLAGLSVYSTTVMGQVTGGRLLEQRRLEQG